MNSPQIHPVSSERITLAALVAASGVHAEPADDAGGVRLFCGTRDAVRRDAFNLADYGVDASCGPFLHMTPRDQRSSVAGCRMHRRGDDGFPLGADGVMRDAYGKIPVAADGKFQHNYGTERPIAIRGWAWSEAFRRWGALVTFADGWHGFTWPRTWSELAASVPWPRYGGHAAAAQASQRAGR